MKFTTCLLNVCVILLCAGGFAVHASDISTANQCLAYGKRAMKENPQMMNLLSQSKIIAESIQINNYSQALGKQFISTELVAKIHSDQEKLGSILCLFESDDKPLYFHLTLQD
ncbi:hypothetical protein QQF54_09615 [Lelliottia sp. V106_10]|uniref:hypothetical protein n=1 Tax=Lelliottia wanjuensis TaxID=3050585 RepID=UPI00254F998E|nr:MULTISPECIES: hypothetical protein [unclassified Lelliottia]MDK9358914.1 hypothetical protein [Lelliottia sp. V106_16]MDK9373602.1 hypothetical protein [Lelliottia sp. V106_10]MDK9600358.1 hypothetical protein [Lelliottia sp. V106_5]